MPKTEWWYDWPETYDGKFHLSLNVDEDSSSADLEAEIEYWSEQLMVFDPPDPHRKAIIQAIKWMNLILGAR